MTDILDTILCLLLTRIRLCKFQVHFLNWNFVSSALRKIVGLLRNAGDHEEEESQSIFR